MRVARATLAAAGRYLADQWRAQVELWDRWAARQEPWRAEGRLRWRRIPGGWTLDGSHVPDAGGLPGAGTPGPRARTPSRPDI